MLFEIHYTKKQNLDYISGDIESCCAELMEQLKQGRDIFMVTIRYPRSIHKSFEIENMMVIKEEVE